MGRSLGKGMREFKDSVTGLDEKEPTTTPPAALPSAPSEPAATPEPEAVPAEKPERETVS
jgi:Sec-independent protein translocase protein TatA